MKVFILAMLGKTRSKLNMYKRIIARIPKIDGWLDKDEIVGADDLIEKQGSIRSLLFQSSLAR